MMFFKDIFILTIIFILLLSCNKYHNISDSRVHKDERELEYYYAFTEATKLALFGNFNEAIALYNQCLKFKPNNPAVYFQISNIFLRIRKLDLAKEYALKSYKLDKSNYWYLIHLASLYQMQLNLDSTIMFYKKIVELKKNDFNSNINLALLLKQNKEYREAKNVIKKIEKINGVNDRTIFLKHDLYNNLKKKKKAIKVLKEGSIFYPDNIDISGLLAEYYYDNNYYEQAESIYKRLFKIDSANNKVLLSYADYLLNSERTNEAFSLYDRVFYNADTELNDKILLVSNFVNNIEYIREYSDNIKGKIDFLIENYKDYRINTLEIDFFIKTLKLSEAAERIKVLFKNNNSNSADWERLLYLENSLLHYDSVIHYADIAISYFGNSSTFCLFKGIALMQKSDIKNAINSFRTGIDLSENLEIKISFYSYLGESYNKMGLHDSSDYYFKEALKIDENNLVIRNNYSYYLAERGENFKYAKTLSSLTIKKEHQNATYLDTYAWIMFKMKKYRIALKYIEKAIKFIENDNAEVYDHYGDILFINSYIQKAIDAWNISLKIENNKQIELKILHTQKKLFNNL